MEQRPVLEADTTGLRMKRNQLLFSEKQVGIFLWAIAQYPLHMSNQTRFWFLLAQKLTGKMNEESVEEFEQLKAQHADHCEQARVIIGWWKSKQNDDDDYNVTRDAFQKILPSLKKQAQKKEAVRKEIL